MSLFVASLNSGSNGNCYYIGNQEDAVFVDGGVSCRETERRMKRLGLSIRKVKAIFVTHEHSDHIYGVSQLSKKYQIPVYITQETLQNSRLSLKEHLVIPFLADVPVAIGKLSVLGFSKEHDAVDPYSFTVTQDAVTVGIFTDIGFASDQLVKHFKQCHAAFLESNYDEDLLENGKYPIYLKNRIRDGKGHLSNRQAAQLFIDHRPDFMTHLFLSHLSQHNNSQRIVQNLFEKIAGPTQVIIASRYRESKLYHVRNIPGYTEKFNQNALITAAPQLTLF